MDLNDHNNDGSYPKENLLHRARSLEELRLISFASFLGTAQTLGLEEPVIPLPEPLLGKLLSPKILFDKTNTSSSHTCSFPSFSIKNDFTSSLSAEKGMSQKETAAFNLAFPVFVDNFDVETAPVTLLTNFSDSFMSLVESRLRTSKNALIQEVMKRGGSSEAKTLLKVLSGGATASSPISLTTIVTSLRAFPLAEQEVGGEDVFLALVFESTMDMAVLGTTVTVTAQTSGKISGSFHYDGLLKRVEIVFDTITLLDSLMKQVRYVVKKVIARAAGIAHKMVKPPSSTNTPEPLKCDSDESFSFDESMKTLKHLTKLPDVTSSTDFSKEIAPSKQRPWEFIKPHDVQSLDSNSFKVKEKQPKYQLFSWLEGDKMLIKESSENLLRTEHSNSYLDLARANKRKKVSFAN
mmetsp:Transcript_53221/g.64164  ORF Transcript_53221/g.64164 Transcript_53221/m.64164 type:complete len:408 (-) Transcript_53221:121-1344(-)|eukprot:CAMPEP_0172509272 /NCGR_PEP_ID=MMETSP1066-20121228/218874_1 /TAXON_ID=671091 /ORGANISM="Coscinodiscus wailesii, Strain CCMP2513" /LENGTH=407 /DNA_ID=CAMNT_0013287669 /DNA_START=41 /DNA_END=1264 /DNA_ORIENTATION=+